MIHKYFISVAEHLTAQHSAIKMLHARVKLVLRYVQAVESGELKGNHEVLRAACSLSHRLPVLNNPKFKADFYNVSINIYMWFEYKFINQTLYNSVFFNNVCIFLAM